MLELMQAAFWFAAYFLGTAILLSLAVVILASAYVSVRKTLRTQ